MSVAVDAPKWMKRREWTVDDLAELPSDLPYELINGRLLVPSPTFLHQDLCVRVLLALEANCPDQYAVGMDLSLRVNHRNEPRPDVVVVKRELLSRSPLPVENAILVVEVISPESTFRDLVDKTKLYATAGVQTYWVIDPLHGDITVTEMLLDGGKYEYGVSTADIFTTERPWAVTLDLPALSTRRKSLE